MRQSNLSARVAPFVLTGLRTMAAEQGVALNQLVNLALGQVVALHREPTATARAQRAGDDPKTPAEALPTLDGPGTDEPLPGDEWGGGDVARAARRASWNGHSRARKSVLSLFTNPFSGTQYG